jgi:hypothetical protein
MFALFLIQNTEIFLNDVSEFYFYMYKQRMKVLTFPNAILKLLSESIFKLPEIFHILPVHHNVTIICITKSVERERLIHSEQLSMNENVAYVEVLRCAHVTENNMSKYLCRTACK